MKLPPKPAKPAPVVLTPEQQAMATERENLTRALEILKERQRQELRALKSTIPKCKSHVWTLPSRAEYVPYGRDKWFICDYVYCAICGVDGGWVCQENLISPCEYATDDTLRDQCIHCGLPEERK